MATTTPILQSKQTSSPEVLKTGPDSLDVIKFAILTPREKVERLGRFATDWGFKDGCMLLIGTYSTREYSAGILSALQGGIYDLEGNALELPGNPYFLNDELKNFYNCGLLPQVLLQDDRQPCSVIDFISAFNNNRLPEEYAISVLSP